MEETKKITLEDLAWDMYQNGSLRPGETEKCSREEFSKHKCYDFYIGAVKHFLNKGIIPKTKKSKPPKKEFPIINVPANGNPNWGDGARTMCFVYSKNNGNFILEGYRGEVEEYLKKNHTHYFCYFSMWHFGHSRGYWRFWKDKSVTIFTPSKIAKEWKYRVIKYKPSDGYGYSVSTKKEDTVLKFKRLPKHWIPEFDEL